MKKIILIMAFLCSVSVVQGQTQFNLADDIDLGASNIINFVGPINGWGATHGTPDYYNTGQLYMWHNWDPFYENADPGIGEGVFRSFKFFPNTEYIILLGIKTYTSEGRNGSAPHGSIKILLANDVAAHGLPPGEPIPSYPGSQLVYSYTGGNLNAQTLVLHFTTGDQAYDNIVIYPEALAKPTNLDLTLDCVSIFGCPAVGNKYYFNNTLPSGVLNQKAAFIGSGYGSVSSMTSSDPNANTVVYASENITLQGNTTLSVAGSNKIELSMVNRCDYPFEVPQNFGHGTIQSFGCSAARPSESAGILTGNANGGPEFELFPNPANSALQIKMSAVPIGEVTFSVWDLTGRMQFSMKKAYDRSDLSGMKETINLSQLPPGNYLLKMNDGLSSKVKKFVIVR